MHPVSLLVPWRLDMAHEISPCTGSYPSLCWGEETCSSTSKGVVRLPGT